MDESFFVGGEVGENWWDDYEQRVGKLTYGEPTRSLTTNPYSGKMAVLQLICAPGIRLFVR
jgi:hypothetical protein